jgi:hypothetical protein
MAEISGWLGVALIVLAATLPLWQRLRHRRRAAPDAPPTQRHVLVGMAAAAVVFAHTLLSVLALGSEDAIVGGTLAIAAGAVAFLVLIAHTGIGLQLRDPRLRLRPAKRRSHVITAITLSVAAAIHAALLARAAG